MKRDEWVRVKSESELRPGMAVQLRNCMWCGKRETLTLLNATRASKIADAPGNVMEVSRSKDAWTVIGGCGSRPCVFYGAIEDHRLFRLADWNFDEASDDTTAPVRVLVGAETGTTVTKARAGK